MPESPEQFKKRIEYMFDAFDFCACVNCRLLDNAIRLCEQKKSLSWVHKHIDKLDLVNASYDKLFKRLKVEGISPRDAWRMTNGLLRFAKITERQIELME